MTNAFYQYLILFYIIVLIFNLLLGNKLILKHTRKLFSIGHCSMGSSRRECSWCALCLREICVESDFRMCSRIIRMWLEAIVDIRHDPHYIS